MSSFFFVNINLFEFNLFAFYFNHYYKIVYKLDNLIQVKCVIKIENVKSTKTNKQNINIKSLFD
jgi:hypothetical protein